MSDSVFPRLGRGRPTEGAKQRYNAEVAGFIDVLIRLSETIGFKMSARGWCYAIEGKKLITKGEFDACEKLINSCRKNGLLPNGFIAGDKSRNFSCIERFIDETSPDEEAEAIIAHLQVAHQNYLPKSFWEDQKFFVQLLVEKVDLVSLFTPICEKYAIPISNAKGWSSIGQRKEMAFRFKWHEDQGRVPVLLYCGDFDPAGLQISVYMKDNLDSISDATGWSTENLIIDRFGLNYDFIIANNLMWIDNLKTGRDKDKGTNDLANPKHPDHLKPYVQKYVAQYGVRKCEANAIVVVPKMGRKLCEAAINKYIPAKSVKKYWKYIYSRQDEVFLHVQRLIKKNKDST